MLIWNSVVHSELLVIHSNNLFIIMIIAITVIR
jgi:hypothetical protein